MEYDIGEAFQKIEEEMISSMLRNLNRHIEIEENEGLNYSMWQAEQLSLLNDFRLNNKEMFSGYFSSINTQIGVALKQANDKGRMDQEIEILKAIQNGAKVKRAGKGLQQSFFRMNERKMKALINATTKDMKKAEVAMLRRANDEYRKIIYNSQVFYNSGAGTLTQCVDMAMKDFMSKGINCIEYSNGARVCIDTYARMALRTAQTRAYIAGESEKRDEWGVNTVIVNKRGVACPKCLQWIGKVFYDDIYGSLPVPDDKYPRLSTAIEGGLYHPNCKDSHTTYFEGVTPIPKPMTQAQVDEANRVYALEQRQRHNERQIRKYKRLELGCTDPENKQKYAEKHKAWQRLQNDFVKSNSDVLKRNYSFERTLDGLPPIDPRKATDMYDRYKAVLQDLAPDSLDKFEDIRYNNSEKWKELKAQYRIVNQYEVYGKVPPRKILELDSAAWHTKQNGFDYSSLSGRARKDIKNLSRSGNAAIMEFDGNLYFSHSQFGDERDFPNQHYAGKYPAVGLSEIRQFEVLDLGDNIKREFDTEAKFLEFVSKQKSVDDQFEVTILSEKHICKSCEGVVEQFKRKYPSATVNIVSGKRGYNGDPDGNKTWKYRGRKGKSNA